MRRVLLFSLLLVEAAGLFAQQPVPPPQQPGKPTQAPPATLSPQSPSLIVILDPGHGGIDGGARGSAGVLEKNIVLDLARSVRVQLEAQGIHALLTRETDANPSFDDRAAMANARRLSVFISLHVSSTGTIGTARAYFYDLPSPPAAINPADGKLIPWEQAQAFASATSHRLADLIAAELARQFAGSPPVAGAAAVRALRSVTGPAIAVELSSVSVADAGQLTRMGQPLGAALAKALAQFRPGFEGAR